MDTIENAQMWGDGKAYRTGRIQFNMVSGKGLWTGNDHKEGSFNINTGNGLLVGVTLATNHAETSIARMALLFMKGKIIEVVNKDFIYDDNLEALNAKHT